MSTSETSTRWYLTPQFRKRALIAVALVLVVEGSIAVFVRDNDLFCHVRHGQGFLNGNPYEHSNDWYPVGRMMLNASLALLPYRVTRFVLYLVALGAALASLRLWERMAQRDRPADGRITFAAAMLTGLLAFTYILRELDECGLQILLLFMITAGAWAFARRKHASCGCWLALAATYKSTPLLFLPFLLFKREWKPALWMGGFLVFWNLVPAVYLGWETTLWANGQWFNRARSTARIVDPSENGIEPPKQQNQGLQAAVVRYTMTQPPGNPLRLKHAAFVQFGNLTPRQANLAVKAVFLLFAGVLAWRFRHRWNDGADADMLSEWATVALLCALLSPLCWKHHFVLGLPALYLTARHVLTTGDGNRKRWIALATIGCIVLLTRRFLVGRELAIVLQSYKLDTLVALLSIALVLTLPREQCEESIIKLPADADRPLRRAA
jgi:hypothetical protein